MRPADLKNGGHRYTQLNGAISKFMTQGRVMQGTYNLRSERFEFRE
jgi:hypothetical protein